MKEIIIKTLKENIGAMKTSLTNSQLNKLADFNEFLQMENRKYNLTAINNPEEVAIRHFLDSLYLAEAESFQKASKIIDIGSGAGFPGMPLAIAYPQKKFLLVDSLKKRIEFINKAVDILDLTNVRATHQRAEAMAKEKKHRESYDFVTARAVASMNILVEYCLPFVRLGGFFVAMKFGESDEELSNSMNAIEILGGKVVNAMEYSLKNDKEFKLIEIEKIKETPIKYPRRPGMASKRPLF